MPGSFQRGGMPPPGYLCKICQVPGHYIYDCPQRDGEHRSRRSNADGDAAADGGGGGEYGRMRPLPEGYVCRICRVPGHHISNCPSRSVTYGHSGADGGQRYGGEPRMPSKGYRCRYCHIAGHFSEDCPDRRT